MTKQQVLRLALSKDDYIAFIYRKISFTSYYLPAFPKLCFHNLTQFIKQTLTNQKGCLSKCFHKATVAKVENIPGDLKLSLKIILSFFLKFLPISVLALKYIPTLYTVFQTFLQKWKLCLSAQLCVLLASNNNNVLQCEKQGLNVTLKRLSSKYTSSKVTTVLLKSWHLRKLFIYKYLF